MKKEAQAADASSDNLSENEICDCLRDAYKSMKKAAKDVSKRRIEQAVEREIAKRSNSLPTLPVINRRSAK